MEFKVKQLFFKIPRGSKWLAWSISLAVRINLYTMCCIPSYMISELQ